MIIYRKHQSGSKPEDKKYDIIDQKGKKITDRKILAYIEGLVIPPAYRDVKIFYEKSPKILFEGFDDKDRKQQIYSSKWCKRAENKKFKGLQLFGKMLPKIFLKINANIAKRGFSQEKLISIIIRIISLCYFRVGNIKYQKLYGSFGISNIKRRHLTLLSGGRVQIKFIGKKGVENQCIVSDSIITRELRLLYNTKSREEHLFTYDTVETTTPGQVATKKIITAIDVNNWLKEFHPSFTSKMFRTFDTNTLLLDFIVRNHTKNGTRPTQTKLSQRKKVIVEAMKEISQCVNNTPAICRKSYANQDLINMYIDHPKKYERLLMGENVNNSRTNFIKFLKSNY